MNRIVYLCAMCASLPAATISFTFNGAVNASAVQRSLDSGTTWTAQNVGQMQVTVSSTSGFAGPVPTVFWTFCVEPAQGISAGTSYTYDINPLQNAPTNVSGGMGAIKADLLRELYGRYYSTFQQTLTVVNASALQIATWEIIRETTATYNVSTGSIQFKDAASPNPNFAAIVLAANTMLSSLNGTGPMLTQLYSIQHATNQDLAFRSEVTIPEPGTCVLTALALALAWRRRQNPPRLQ